MPRSPLRATAGLSNAPRPTTTSAVVPTTTDLRGVSSGRGENAWAEFAPFLAFARAGESAPRGAPHRSGAGMFDEEFRVAAGAGGEGVVAVVGGRVDGDHVGAVGQGAAAEELQVAVVFGQHGEGAAFGGDVEPAGGVDEGGQVAVGAALDVVAFVHTAGLLYVAAESGTLTV